MHFRLMPALPPRADIRGIPLCLLCASSGHECCRFAVSLRAITSRKLSVSGPFRAAIEFRLCDGDFRVPLVELASLRVNICNFVLNPEQGSFAGILACSNLVQAVSATNLHDK